MTEERKRVYNQEELGFNMEQLRARKGLLENELTEVMSNALNRFREETGYSIEHISTRLYDITTIGETNRHFILTNVACDVALKV